MPKDGDIAGDRHMDLVDAGIAGDPIPVSSGGGTPGPRRGRDNGDHHPGAGQSQPASGDEPITAVVAGPTQDDDRTGRPSAGVRGQGPDRGRHSGPGMLHQSLLGHAQGLRPAVRPGHRLGADRGQRGLARPTTAQPAQVQFEQDRVVGRERYRGAATSGAGRAAGAGRGGGLSHGPRSVADPARAG